MRRMNFGMRLRMATAVWPVCALLLLSQPTFAAVFLTNGSFEAIGALYDPALGGIYAAAGWTNLSGLNIQAASMQAGQEGTRSSTTGSRILRLANDEGDLVPANVGRIAQNLGTMVAGETYTFKADAFGGSGIGLNWGATAKFVNAGIPAPSTVYASQSVDSVTAGSRVTDAFSLGYTAQPADDGQPLWIWLQAKAAGAGQTTRGGLDNARLTVSSGPSSAKDILTVTFGAFGDATIADSNITIVLPFGTVVTNLAPTYTLSPGATGNPVSGTARDFTTPKTYAVTAQDASTKTYSVTVTVAPPSSAKDILTFDFGALGPAAISETNVQKYVPGGTPVTNLAPTFTLSPFATAAPVSGTARDFSSPKTYMVTAQDGSTKTYDATVAAISGNINVQDNGTSLRVDNGLVRLDVMRTNSGLAKTFSALNASSQWQPVCSSFVPDFAAHPAGNALFNASRTAARYRIHEMATNQYAVSSLTTTSVTVQVAGAYQGAALTETMTLRSGDKYFHVAVAANLPTNSLDYCMSSYVFESDGTPEFVHSPTTKKDEYRWASTPASGQVVGDMAFHSPAIVLQTSGLFAALVPDLDSINRDKVLSPDARRTMYVGPTIYDTPIEPDKYSHCQTVGPMDSHRAHRLARNTRTIRGPG